MGPPLPSSSPPLETHHRRTPVSPLFPAPVFTPRIRREPVHGTGFPVRSPYIPGSVSASPGPYMVDFVDLISASETRLIRVI